MIATGSKRIIANFILNVKWSPLATVQNEEKWWMHGTTGLVHRWDDEDEGHASKAQALFGTDEAGAVAKGHVRGGEPEGMRDWRSGAYLQGSREAFLKHKTNLQSHIAKNLKSRDPVEIEVAGNPKYEIKTGEEHTAFWKGLE
jgi:hypothetical protein